MCTRMLLVRNEPRPVVFFKKNQRPVYMEKVVFVAYVGTGAHVHRSNESVFRA